LAREIKPGKRTEEVQRLYWSYAETISSSQIDCMAVERLIKERDDLAQKLQSVEQQLEASQQQIVTLEVTKMELVQQQEQRVNQLNSQLAQQEKESWEKTNRLSEFQQKLTQVQQQETAARDHIQQLEQMNVKFQDQVNVPKSEFQDKATFPKVIQPNRNSSEVQQAKTRQQTQTLKDMASQGSFPMVVFLVMLVLVVFSVAKLVLAIGLEIRSLFTAISRAWKPRSQATQSSQNKSFKLA